MAETTTLNGISYSIPDPGDTGWGSNLTSFLLAIAPGVLQKTGGLFTLTSVLDFGGTNGLKSLYYSSRNSNPATAGILRLSNTDTIAFRNFANAGNLSLSVDASDNLLFNGSPVGQFTSTANRAVITNGSGTLTVSPTTAAEIAFVSGVTSAIQTQLNGKEPTLGFTPEDVANKSTNTALGSSNTLYPTQNAVKTYVDNTPGSILSLGYRRPNLSFISVTTVDVENNTGTTNQTTIVFPDGTFRSVIEDTSSTSKYRRFIITETAEFTSGTENSGIRSGLSEATNTWYAIYVVKSQINAANFVLVGDTTLPLQTNFSTLNSRYGTNSWLYLGMIRNGDNSGATGDILAFVQESNYIQFSNTVVTAAASLSTSFGLRLANVTGAATLTYTYSAGIGTTNIPDHLKLGIYCGATALTTSKFVLDTPATGTNYHAYDLTNGGSPVGSSDIHTAFNSVLSLGLRLTGTGNSNIAIMLRGFYDPILMTGINNTL